jgi:uncharacterized protein with PIN domain
VITAVFRFYAALNDFLRPDRRFVSFIAPVAETDTVKHLIESFGVPHTEVDLIIVNGEPVDWSRRLEDNDRVAVYPTLTCLTPGAQHLQPDIPANPRFVLDGHLGRLAAFLRMLGFDTFYERSADDERLAGISEKEDRILLTRDAGLLKRRNVARGHFISSDNPKTQLRDIVLNFDLMKSAAPLSRCMECNGLLLPVAKSEIAHRLLPYTLATKHEFSTCANCAKLYWKGSHHAEMLQVIEELTTIGRAVPPDRAGPPVQP